MDLPTNTSISPILADPIAIVIKVNQEPPKEQLYTIKQGDNLTKIAQAHTTTVERLWAKNTELSNPDLIEPDKPLKIPSNEEVLTDRPMPVTITSLGQEGSGAAVTGGSSNRGSSSGLTGTIGYARAGGNCVDEPGVNSPRNGTNPIGWPVLTQQPYIGATALWTYNHTGVVVGIWDNGDIEVRHQNYSYPQSRFPRSAFRGFR